MGACAAKPGDGSPMSPSGAPKSALRKKTGIYVCGEGPPLVVLDFDLTLTSKHLGRSGYSPDDAQRDGVGIIFDRPPGRLRSVQNFVADVRACGATVAVVTLNTPAVVQVALELGGLSECVDTVICCSSGQKGEKVAELVHKHAPSRVVFADDDGRNIADVREYLSNCFVMHVTGGKGLQPRHMEWIYYAVKGQLSEYRSFERGAAGAGYAQQS